MDSQFDYSALYLDWLQKNIEQYRVSDNVCRITLPYLDINNDEIEIYIINETNGSFRLTDDGEILNNLNFMGFDFSKNRRAILERTIASYGVDISPDNELFMECSFKDDLPIKKHLLAQCMIKVNDLFFLNKNSVKNIFSDDVQQFLEFANIRYVPDISITGKSKLSTHFDFIIGHSNEAPERLIKVINHLTNSHAKNIIFEWSDTKEMRAKNSILYSFIQDMNGQVSLDAIGALKEYGIKPVLWSDRDKYISELVA